MSLFNIILSKRSVDINEIKNLESKFVNMRSYSLNRLNDFEIQSKIIENNPIPKIGLFGNHQIAFLSPKKLKNDNLIHNYHYNDFSVYDVYFYLIHLSKKNMLPSEKIFIFFTTPNNDNGNLITTLSKQTKHVISFNSFIKNIKNFSLESQLLLIKSFLSFYYTSTFDYQVTANNLKVLINLLTTNKTNRFLNVEYSRKMKIISDHDNCRARYPNGKFIFLKSDGSYSENCIKFNLIKNHAKLNGKPYFTKKDILKLNSITTKIERLLKKEGVELYFVIPPVYEDDRKSEVDLIFDKAIEGVDKNIVIFDHRYLRNEIKIFLDYDHLNSKYLKIVLKDANIN